MRNLHFWFAVGITILSAAFVFAVLRIALAESFWLDELHTSWTVSGQWQEIASRAKAGNQTPLYFWLAGLITRTLGQLPESILRLPSIVAWLCAVALAAWLVRSKAVGDSSSRTLFALAIAAWIVLDRDQWFYATEARPYALVQFVSLAGWCCVDALLRSIDQRTSEQKRTGALALIAVWCVLAVLNVNLHLTAALPVLCQWLVGGLLVYRKLSQRAADSERPEQTVAPESPRNLATSFIAAWTIGAIGSGLALLPILQIAFPVWQRRTQWSAFASDVTFSKTLTVFPFAPVLLCVVVACLVDRMWRSKESGSLTTTDVRLLWWSAMLGPWLLAWALTAFGVAPMFHKRFVIASALPLFIVGGIELLRCRHAATHWIAGIAVAFAIVFSQGSVGVWRAGYLVGSLRVENWRAATQSIREQISSGDIVLCSSGLIEANAGPDNPLTLPLDDAFEEYLSFPLRGGYRAAEDASHPAHITALLGDHRQWSAQAISSIESQANKPNRIWLVYRGAPGRLKSKLADFLADMRLKQVPLEAREPKRFGNLHVVELSLPSLADR